MTVRVCFVCLGNICRSPIAETVMRELVRERGLGGAVEVSSAGTAHWHVGEPADARALAVLEKNGYDASAHRARQFTAASFEHCDVVLALDRSNLAALRRLAPPGQDGKVQLLMSYAVDEDVEVPDPYYGDGDGFADVLAMVERACRGLLDRLTVDPPA